MSSSKLENKFQWLWKVLGGTPLEREIKFHPKRKFRFDFGDSKIKTAIEIEGGQWANGAHNRGGHYASDCEKYNLAIMEGWKVFRLTTDMVTASNIQPIIIFIKNSLK